MTFEHDDRLRLIFTCAHPALAMEARVALTLKVVAGLSTEAIARAFLTGEATMGQRLLRAKNKIAHAGIPYQVPGAAALPERLDGVLATVYLIFTSGYARSAADLAAEAIRLGRLLTQLMPDSDEARALLALMLLQHARREARTVDGELVTLEEQDRSRWDRVMVAEGLALVERPGECGPYRVQAELAAVHAVLANAADTDWTRIVRLYDELLRLSPVAGGRAQPGRSRSGWPTVPWPGSRRWPGSRMIRSWPGSTCWPAARADLLSRAGRTAEAIEAIDQAIALAPTETERRQLVRRRDELQAGGP